MIIAIYMKVHQIPSMWSLISCTACYEDLRTLARQFMPI